MGRITDLEKTLTRHCPDLEYPGEGTTVMAAIRPGGGGELHLWPKGQNKGTSGRTFPFCALLEGKGSQPTGWGSWVRVEDLASALMTAPGIPLDARQYLVDTIYYRALYQQWVESREEADWDEWCAARKADPNPPVWNVKE